MDEMCYNVNRYILFPKAAFLLQKNSISKEES